LKGQGKPRPNGLQPTRLGKEENPLPSPVEAALGLYLENRDELKLSHEAIVKTIEQLLELFPERPALQVAVGEPTGR
jgi:hypothetical protein